MIKLNNEKNNVGKKILYVALNDRYIIIVATERTVLNPNKLRINKNNLDFTLFIIGMNDQRLFPLSINRLIKK